VNVAVILVVEETLLLLTVTPEPLTLAEVAPTTKFVPVRVTVDALPVTLVLGDIELSVGAGVAAALTVKATVLVEPWDVETLTLCTPSVAFEAMANVAVIDVPCFCWIVAVTPVPSTNTLSITSFK
jgi:hypothetical protein